ncbi:MAG TPA: histidine kinase dimerization/phospho-acceptor domain-containing protein, partial [Terriglobales bacterium]|nr:histidine kinase dimerization/phospho-acceptor domain-containing protein [Terriglobales bacterium]
MKLKTKLTASIALLVLLVVLAVTLVYLAGVVRQQTQLTYTHADFLAHEIYNEMNQELAAANASGSLAPGPAGLASFFQNLTNSPPLVTLLSSAIGYNGAIRDVALVAPSGTVALDSNPILEGQTLPQRPLMSEVIQSGLWGQVRAIFGQDQIYAVTLATQVGEQPLGDISIGVDTVLLRQDMLGRIQQLAYYGLVIVLLATALAWGLSDLVLHPLGDISAQLDLLAAGLPRTEAAGADAAGHARRRPATDFGVVSSKIERLGQQMADVRQVYSALQENVAHVLESVEEGLLLFDAEGLSVMASAATPRLLGRAAAGVAVPANGGEPPPASELAGQTVEALFPGNSALDRAVREAVRRKTPLAAHESERHPGGRRLLLRVDPVRDRLGNTGALLTLRDAEPVHQLENELEVARRLSAVGRLTRGVAHEVKNPLNAMAIHLDLLREKAGSGDTRLQPHIQVLRREIERLDRVVRTFLDFSRPVELHLETCDLADVVHGVAQLATADADAHGIHIAVHAPRPGPRVWLDRDLIEQALLNLVNNGLQAMQATGTAAGKELSLSVFERERQASIRIRDQGPGVPAENQDKIFDLY